MKSLISAAAHALSAVAAGRSKLPADLVEALTNFVQQLAGDQDTVDEVARAAVRCTALPSEGLLDSVQALQRCTVALLRALWAVPASTLLENQFDEGWLALTPARDETGYLHKLTFEQLRVPEQLGDMSITVHRREIVEDELLLTVRFEGPSGVAGLNAACLTDVQMPIEPVHRIFEAYMAQREFDRAMSTAQLSVMEAVLAQATQVLKQQDSSGNATALASVQDLAT